MQVCVRDRESERNELDIVYVKPLLLESEADTLTVQCLPKEQLVELVTEVPYLDFHSLYFSIPLAHSTLLPLSDLLADVYGLLEDWVNSGSGQFYAFAVCICSNIFVCLLGEKYSASSSSCQIFFSYTQCSFLYYLLSLSIFFTFFIYFFKELK